MFEFGEREGETIRGIYRLVRQNTIRYKNYDICRRNDIEAKVIFSLYGHKSYIPIGNAVSLISSWAEQGAEIVYCTSRKGTQAVDMAELLRVNCFRGTRLYYRDRGQKYKNLVETVHPNVLIEDDCKSIGGSWQMCITHVSPEIKNTIRSIVVNEFKGIDGLSVDIDAL